MANDPVIIELAGLPQGKGRPRFVRSTGIAFTPDKTRSYEAALRCSAQAVMAGRAPFAGPVSVIIEAFFPIPASWSRRKRDAALAGRTAQQTNPDLDNIMKCIDAFNEVVWRDDKQIIEAVIRKTYSDKPRLRIEINELNYD